MAQGWDISASADTITFDEAPPVGANNVVVNEYATGSINATSVWAIGAWNSEYGFPTVVEFYSDRMLFASTRSQPQSMWASRTGDYTMFGKSTPLADDDAFMATMNSRQLNRIVGLIAKQHLLSLTTGGVWKIGGGDNEVLTPSTVSARPQPSVGSGDLQPLDVGETAIYTSYKGSQVRDLAYTFEADGYSGSDLTTFAAHMLNGRTIGSWCWVSEPWSAVFSTRDDGALLCMTYKREHQVVAWSRNETQGAFDRVESIAESGTYGTYVVVSREIDGQTLQYVERISDTSEDDYREEVGVDSALTYDGRNSGATTLSLSGGATVDDEVTITASANAFVASNVEDEVVLHYDDVPLRIRIAAVDSATVVRGYASRPLIADDLTPGTAWALGVNTLSGLGHLEGREVLVGGDGYDLGTYTVSGGSITLERAAVLAHVGLAFVADFESLDMTVIGGESVATRNKLIREVGILVHRTNQFAASTQGFDVMEEYKPRDDEAIGVPPELRTEWITLNVPGSWEQNPRVYIRGQGPYRTRILAIEPRLNLGR